MSMSMSGENNGAPLWNHVHKISKVAGEGNWRFKCKFCQEIFVRSYSRVKAHLLQIKGCGVKACAGIKESTIRVLKNEQEKADNRKLLSSVSIIAASVDLPPSDSKKRKMTDSAISKAYDINSRDQLDCKVARMFYAHYSPYMCPNLEVLSVKSCPNVTDASIFQIATCCPKLVELDISFCHEVSHESLEVIGKKCPNLKILKRNLMNWLDPSQHNGIVPSEYLKTCPQDGNMEAAAIGKFMLNLEHLELRFSKLSAYGLIPLSQGCLKLEHLDLFGCANLTSRDIEIASANLKNLNKLVKPNFYIPRSVFHTERYGHWRLYDERFQTNVFQI